MSAERRVTILSEPHGQVRHGVFRLRDEVAGAPDLVELVLEIEPGRQVAGTATSFFDAMVAIRRQIEPEGFRLSCYGASRDVYPSPMARDMGTGHRAYRLTTGEQGVSRLAW